MISDSDYTEFENFSKWLGVTQWSSGPSLRSLSLPESGIMILFAIILCHLLLRSSDMVSCFGFGFGSCLPLVFYYFQTPIMRTKYMWISTDNVSSIVADFALCFHGCNFLLIVMFLVHLFRWWENGLSSFEVCSTIRLFIWLYFMWFAKSYRTWFLANICFESPPFWACISNRWDIWRLVKI